MILALFWEFLFSLSEDLLFVISTLLLVLLIVKLYFLATMWVNLDI